MASRTLTTLAVFAMCVAAATAFVAPQVPQEWRQMQRVPDNHDITLTIAVRQEGDAELEAACQSVSDPTSASYGEYYSLAGLSKLLRAEANHNLVAEWLRESGAHTLSSSVNSEVIYASMTAGAAAAAFGVEMHAFLRHDGALLTRASTPPQIPSAVRAAVDGILGLYDFPLFEGRRSLNRMRRVRQHVAEMQQRMTLEKAQEAGRDGEDNFVLSPTVGMTYASDTNGSVFFSQPCDGYVANTTKPCRGQVLSYDAMCYQNGVPTVYNVDVDKLVMQCPMTLFGRFCEYLLTPPIKFTEGDFFNCSIRARSNSSVSSWSSLNWQNVSTADQGLMNTPYVTPELLTDFYGLGQDMPETNATQSVIEFDFQFYLPSDLTAFYKYYNVNHTGSVTVKGVNAPLAGGESTLDIEWITAMAPAADTVFWYKTPTKSNDTVFILGWLLDLANTTNPPHVSSISYGMPEANYGKAYGDWYIPRANTEFLKACARGISIVIASGDAGATNDGHGTSDCKVLPDFPSSSPWITSVSASFISTDVTPREGNAQKRGEAAVTIQDGMFWTTGGGFSNEATCKQPWYQATAVKQYLATAPTGEMPAHFNSSNRAYPDVAAVGHNLMCTTGGYRSPVDGTSAATPIFAAMITRLNQYRLSKGMPVVGFANPLLYKAADQPGLFYDITGPANNRCGAWSCCPVGYEVTKGYDAVTGLGTMGDFEAMKEFALQSAAAAADARMSR